MRPLILEMVDGTLRGDADWDLQKHLSLCPRCAAEAQQLQDLSRLIKHVPQARLSEGFDNALRVRIAAREERAGAWWVKCKLAAAPIAALAAVLVVFGLVAVRHQMRSPALPVSGAAIATSDRTLLATCLAQHRSYVAGDPLADPSAQALASEVDLMGGAQDSPTSPSESL